MAVLNGVFPTDDEPAYGRVRGRMSETETIKFRLSSLEESVKQLADASRKLAEQQTLMNADIRILVKEQMRLTKTLNSVASYQTEVRSMHSTMQRGFSRIERLERDFQTLRNEFNIEQARDDARRGTWNWIARNWQLLAVLGGGLFYLLMVTKGL